MRGRFATLSACHRGPKDQALNILANVVGGGGGAKGILAKLEKWSPKSLLYQCNPDLRQGSPLLHQCNRFLAHMRQNTHPLLIRIGNFEVSGLCRRHFVSQAEVGVQEQPESLEESAVTTLGLYQSLAPQHRRAVQGQRFLSDFPEQITRGLQQRAQQENNPFTNQRASIGRVHGARSRDPRSAKETLIEIVRFCESLKKVLKCGIAQTVQNVSLLGDKS